MRTALCLAVVGLAHVSLLAGCAERVSELGANDGISSGEPEPLPPDLPAPDEDEPVLCDPGDPAGPDPIDESQGCSAYESVDAESDVRFVVRNDGDEDVILYDPTGCTGGYFLMNGLSAGREVYWPLRNCPPNSWHCERLLADEPNGCSAVCYIFPPVRIEPGGSFEIIWDGRVGVRANIDPACVPTAYEGSESCEVYRPVPPGAYDLEIRWVPAAECESGAECECEVDENGSCLLETLFLPDIGTSAFAPYDGLCDDVLIPVGE